MRIGIVAFSGIYPINIGGPASVAYFIAKYLGELDDDVTLFIRTKTWKQAESLKGIEEFKHLENVKITPIVMDYNLQSLMNIPYLTYKICVTAKKFNFEKFDVVHYNSPPVDVALPFPILAKLKESKQTMAVHGGIFYEIRNHMGRSILKIERNWFDKLIVLNDFSRNLARKAGFSEDKLVTIPNGADLEAINQVEPLNLAGEPKILYVGRLAEIKGVDILLRAFVEVAKEFPRAILYIIGDGPLRASLEMYCRQLGLCERVKFKGFISTTTVYRYYKSTDVLVLPSYLENFSIVLLEAMASKVPIIVSDATGNVEIVKDAENGLVFPRGNWKELSEKIVTLLSDDDLRRKVIAKGYELVENEYNWKTIALKYHETFQSLLNEESVRG